MKCGAVSLIAFLHQPGDKTSGHMFIQQRAFIAAAFHPFEDGIRRRLKKDDRSVFSQIIHIFLSHYRPAAAGDDNAGGFRYDFRLPRLRISEICLPIAFKDILDRHFFLLYDHIVHFFYLHTGFL